MQALDMNSVCTGVGCCMHVHVVTIFDVVKTLLRFVKFLIPIRVTVNYHWHFANMTPFCLSARRLNCSA